MYSIGVILVDLLYTFTWGNAAQLAECKEKLLVQLDREWPHIAHRLRNLNARKKGKPDPESHRIVKLTRVFQQYAGY